jgi:hypothetical protein
MTHGTQRAALPMILVLMQAGCKADAAATQPKTDPFVAKEPRTAATLETAPSETSTRTPPVTSTLPSTLPSTSAPLTGAVTTSAAAPNAAMTIASLSGPERIPPGADPLQVAIARSICNAAFQRKTTQAGKVVVAVGCRSEPPFTRPDEQPRGIVTEYTGDFKGFCEIDAVYKGSFTQAGAEQFAVSFAQCIDQASDADSWDSAKHGSLALLEKNAAGFKVLKVQPRVNASVCTVGRKGTDGRDLQYLVCQSGLWAQTVVDYVYAVDFTRSLPYARSLAVLFSNPSLDCMTLDTKDTKSNALTNLEVVKVNTKETDANGATKVTVEVNRRYSPMTPSIATRLSALCKNNKGEHIAITPLLPPAEKTTLIFEGPGIKPTPGTQKVMAQWGAESRDILGLRPHAPVQ